jgi:hypothetical protein
MTSNEYGNESELERQDRQYLMAEHGDEQANELRTSGDTDENGSDFEEPISDIEELEDDEDESEPWIASDEDKPEPVEPVNSATEHEGCGDEGGVTDTSQVPVTETSPPQAPLSELKRARKAVKPKAKAKTVKVVKAVKVAKAAKSKPKAKTTPKSKTALRGGKRTIRKK